MRAPALLLFLILPACVADTESLSGGLAPDGCYERSGEVALHWATAGRCLAVTYDPRLERHLGDVDAALAAWSNLACSGLCFDAPRADEVPRDAEVDGRIHLAPADPDAPDRNHAEVNFRIETQEILGARGHVDVEDLEGLDPAARPAVWMGLVGGLLGLPAPEFGVPSVRDNGPGARAPDLTEADREDFCRVYGEGGVCGS